MRHSQRGITFIGWLVLLVPVAIVVYAGIRLAPIYLNYMRVAKSLSETASEAKEWRHAPMPSRCVIRWRSTSISRGITHPTIQGRGYPPRE